MQIVTLAYDGADESHSVHPRYNGQTNFQMNYEFLVHGTHIVYHIKFLDVYIGSSY
jgi:hypothetical protein